MCMLKWNTYGGYSSIKEIAFKRVTKLTLNAPHTYSIVLNP